MSTEPHRVSVTVITCMGKTHHFTVNHFTKAYGDTGDKIMFVDAVDLNLPTSEERQNSIVPNTEITTLLKHEPCCSLIVECLNCEDITLRWEFNPRTFKVNDNHSIDYDGVELHISPKSESNKSNQTGDNNV